MYKTISINNTTYQQLNALAKKLNKPKSQLIDDLIREYIDRMHEEEKIALQTYNKAISKLSQKVKLPKGTKINPNNLDESLAAFTVFQSTEKKN